MRISDWSSDVCSSDLLGHVRTPALLFRSVGDVLFDAADRYRAEAVIERARTFTQPILRTDTTADIRQRVGLMQELGRQQQIAFLDQLQPVGNEIADRTFPLAIRIAAAETAPGLGCRLIGRELAVDFAEVEIGRAHV